MDEVMRAESVRQRTARRRDAFVSVTARHERECDCRLCHKTDMAVSEARFSKAWAEAAFALWANAPTD